MLSHCGTILRFEAHDNFVGFRGCFAHEVINSDCWANPRALNVPLAAMVAQQLGDAPSDYAALNIKVGECPLAGPAVLQISLAYRPGQIQLKIYSAVLRPR